MRGPLHGTVLQSAGCPFVVAVVAVVVAVVVALVIVSFSFLFVHFFFIFPNPFRCLRCLRCLRCEVVVFKQNPVFVFFLVT